MEASPGRVVMFLHHPFHLDSRVEREARTLVAHDFEVEVIAVLGEGLPAVELRDGYLIRRVSPRGWGARVATRASGAQIFRRLKGLADRVRWLHEWRCYLRRAYREARRRPAEVYVAHDLDSLAAAVRAKRHIGGKVIYDAHELFADIAGESPRPEPLRRAWIRYEARLIRSADVVFAVTPSRAIEMERRFAIARPKVLRNVPEACRQSDDVQGLRIRLGIEPGRHIVLYLGNMQPNRGLEALIDAMAMLPDAALAILGSGGKQYVSSLTMRAAARGVSKALYIGDPVRPHQVVAAAAGADVGVVVNPNVSLNNYFSLPNKIFEYAGAGIPVVASDFPDMAGLLRHYGFGVTCDPEDPVDIARAIREVLDDVASAGELRARALEAGRELTWENESRIFLSSLGELIPPGAAR